MNKHIIAMLLYFAAAAFFLLYVFLDVNTVLVGAVLLIAAVIFSRSIKK